MRTMAQFGCTAWRRSEGDAQSYKAAVYIHHVRRTNIDQSANAMAFRAAAPIQRRAHALSYAPRAEHVAVGSVALGHCSRMLSALDYTAKWCSQTLLSLNHRGSQGANSRRRLDWHAPCLANGVLMLSYTRAEHIANELC